MNIAFFGTPDFTTEFLDTLLDAGLAPSLIVTNPDRPSGRGMALHSPAPKLWATSHDIRVIQPERITPAVVEELAASSWDLFVVIAYGCILPEALITLPRLGTINVHYSLLPKYRGASPVEAALMNGDSETGITIQQMRFALDSGPIIATRTIAIDITDTAETLREKLNVEARALLPFTIRSLADGSATFTEQDHTRASKVGKLDKSIGNLEAIDDMHKWNLFRAIGGRGWAYTHVQKNGVLVRAKVTQAHLENGRFIIDEIIPENGKRQVYS